MDIIKIEVADLSKVSDGYHTIDELYQHRELLFINLCLMQPRKCCWKHDLSSEWFLLYLESGLGQISYHIEGKYLYLIKDCINEDADHKWDGHESSDVLERLERIAAQAKGT